MDEATSVLVTPSSVSHRSPFRKRERIPNVDSSKPFAMYPGEKRALQWNFVLLFFFGILFTSADVRQVLVEHFGIFTCDILWFVSAFCSGLGLFNIIGTSFIVIRRCLDNEELVKDTKLKRVEAEDEIMLLETPLRPPRNIVPERSAPSTPFGNKILKSALETPQKGKQQNQPHHLSRTSSSVFATPGKFASSPLASEKVIQTVVKSPIFSSVYGTPARSEIKYTPSVTSSLQRTPASANKAGLDYGYIASTPLPDTGSPRVNKLANNRLPEWTEQLRQTLSSQQERTITFPTLDGLKQSSMIESSPLVVKADFVRRIIEADVALIELGLSRTIEECTENLRRWFSHKIMKELKADIELVTEEFSKAGLEHLSPQFPASFSLFSKAQNNSATSNTFMLTGTSFATASKPQTIIELIQKNPNDPMVQKRIKLERYLSFSSLASHRSAVIRRIIELANDDLVGAFRWNRGNFTDGTSNDEDAQILMHFFCAFMDEHLPSEQYYESQPFSSRHFISFDEKPSNRLDAIQIQQHLKQPIYYRLVAEDRIFEVYPGAHNIFHVIVFLVEYVHRRYNGFLGVGNLGSPAIDLVSILNLQ